MYYFVRVAALNNKSKFKLQAFKAFGPVRVEWPGKESANPTPRGYLYIAFEDETRVKASIFIFRR